MAAAASLASLGQLASVAPAAPQSKQQQQQREAAGPMEGGMEPGPDPPLADPALSAAVHAAFLQFLLHSQPERVLRLPPHLFMGVVTYLLHWKSLGLYGLPPPPVEEATLLDALSTLVHRYMVRQRALHGHPEPSTGPAASGALGRELLEAALRASKASLVLGGAEDDDDDDDDRQGAALASSSSDSEGPSDESSGGEEDEDEEDQGGGLCLGGGSSRRRAAASTRGSSGSSSKHKAAKLRGPPGGASLVDRLAEHETARKLVFDFLEPQDLAAAQSVCHRWRRMALPRAAEYFWNVLVCACWWATFPSVDPKHGCCMLEWLRREATFTESFKLKSVTVPTGAAARMPVPRLVGGAEGASSYLSGFTVAVDVADRLMDSLLASATIDLADAQAAAQFFHPVALRDRSPDLRLGNTGYLRGWSFQDSGAVERYLNSGHESYRLEVMVIHKRSGRVACLLPADEECWPAAGPAGIRYGIQSVREGGRQLTVGTFGAATAGSQLRLSFEMFIRLEDEPNSQQQQPGGGMEGLASEQVPPRVSLCVETVAMQLHGPAKDEEEDEEEEEEVPYEQLWEQLALLMPQLLWH